MASSGMNGCETYFLPLPWRERNTFIDFFDDHAQDIPQLKPRPASAGPSFSKVSPPVAPVAPAVAVTHVPQERPILQPMTAPIDVNEHILSAVTTEPFQLCTEPAVSPSPPGKRGGGLRKAMPKRVVEDSVMTKLDQCKVPGKADEVFNDSFEACKASGQESIAMDGKFHAALESQKDTCIDVRSDVTQAIAALGMDENAHGTNSSASDSGSLLPENEVPFEAQEDSATVMIRHIACRYTKKDVEFFLDAAGLNGKYKWVYLPMNPKKSANLGYAFVSFISQSGIDECRRVLDDRVFGDSQSQKRCQVTMAFLQGARSVQKSNRKARMLEKNQAEGSILQRTQIQTEKAVFAPCTAESRRDNAGCGKKVLATGTGKGKGSIGNS